MVGSDMPPDTAQIALGELRIAPFPAECDWDPLRVHIAREPYEAIIAHCRESNRVELCGVLVGEVAKDELGPFLMVSHTIRGEQAASQATQVTFTQDTWAHIHRVMDSEHEGLAIVGWYHTHPGFGVFLSEQDVFIHRNFFNLPWQIALVVDPQSGDEGVFTWRDGEPAQTRRYWVGEEERLVLREVSAGGGDLAAILNGLRNDVDEINRELSHSRRRFRRLRLGILLLMLGLLTVAAWIVGAAIWPSECDEVIGWLRDWLRTTFETH